MACRPDEKQYGYEDSRFEKAVDEHFHCSICYNVLKEPVMCRNNEHIFCRDCISEHLNVNSHRCPECNEELTVETLSPAPRLVKNYLSQLKIKCDYSDRGCPEHIRLVELASHAANCYFAPVKCSNEECGMLINKRELVHHEATVCQYRRVKCQSCKTLAEDVQHMKKKLDEMKTVKEDVEQLKAMMIQMFGKLSSLENTIQISSAINRASNALLGEIVIAGGYNSQGNVLNSVEQFSWRNNFWKQLPSMTLRRIGATSFVYENQLYVAGGCDSEIIEVLNLSECEWVDCMNILPYHCKQLHSVVYHNCAIYFCACAETDDILQLSLTEPNTYKRLSRILFPP